MAPGPARRPAGTARKYRCRRIRSPPPRLAPPPPPPPVWPEAPELVLLLPPAPVVPVVELVEDGVVVVAAAGVEVVVAEFCTLGSATAPPPAGNPLCSVALPTVPVVGVAVCATAVETRAID